jgi:serine/threonine protein kinase
MSSEAITPYRERLNEARLYFEQGIKDGAVEILEELLSNLDQSDLQVEERSELALEVRVALEQMKNSEASSCPMSEQPQEDAHVESQTGEQIFQYALALVDGLFYREAILEFKRAAAVGYRVLDIWEHCGDCAALMEEWDEAIQYYNLVYNEPDIPEVLKKKILLKITKCSQTQRKIGVKASSQAKQVLPAENGASVPSESSRDIGKDTVSAHIAGLDQSSISELLGKTLESWHDAKGQTVAGITRGYKILHPLHIGLTSIVVELEEEETGRHYAGQTIVAPFNKSLCPKTLREWVHAHRMTASAHVVKVLDLAHSGDMFFIVRENLPVSLVDLLTRGNPFPIRLAVFIAHRILEALGDLHLHKGLDEQIRNIHHLDLRPSRILLHDRKPTIKIYNAGIWGLLQKANPGGTAIRKLPLPFLAYRAPEQFKTYLARRKPPVFTDIYQFGTIFYEMLTGVPAFSASSYEEYEIQHCEQYPTPPKVWRPEIPDQLNELIMNCLECDPMKRWRSATQVALFLEKPFHQEIQPPKDGSYAEFMLRVKAA